MSKATVKMPDNEADAFVKMMTKLDPKHIYSSQPVRTNHGYDSGLSEIWINATNGGGWWMRKFDHDGCKALIDRYNHKLASACGDW